MKRGILLGGAEGIVVRLGRRQGAVQDGCDDVTDRTFLFPGFVFQTRERLAHDARRKDNAGVIFVLWRICHERNSSLACFM